MRRSTLGLLTGLIFFAGQSAAIAAGDLRCLLRNEREGQDAYAARVHNSCDARWHGFQPPRPTSGTAYDNYMRRCETACAVIAAGGGGVSTTALLAGGVLVAGGAAAAAAGSKGGGGSPASP